MSTRVGAAVLILCGAFVAALLAVSSGTSASDAFVVVALAAGGSLAAAAAGAALLRTLRRRSLRVQVLAVALATTLTMTVGVLLAAEFMLVSSHDLTVLAVVLVAAGSVAGGAALYLGDMYERDARDVAALAARLAEPDAADSGAPGPFATRDLQRLADQLADVSSRLEASRQRERAIDASRRELVAWISHDLRSPIASIRALAEALDDGVVSDPEDVERYHRAIVHETQRLGSLVDDLFELSRLASGDEPEDQPFVPVGELVGAVLSGVTPSAAVAGVEVSASFEDLPAALVPASDVRRVLRNLLDNAVRHTPSGGRVFLEVSCHGRVLELSVADECGGIPQADLDHVFDVAFRGDEARSRDGGGGGLGLAIAKGLVEGREGTIEVANRARGCRFTVHLPLVTA
ncbi:MAG TPA: HAMP domain-containing sensor histidine kinase [Acidimicrobiales bacterium]|nr:HAMP domain-containing sensor histidine kinase [Acidimicrobiales bacterium]